MYNNYLRAHWRLLAGSSATSYNEVVRMAAERTEVRKGGVVLDVGTGTGLAARSLSRIVGKEGEVYG